MDSKNDIYKKDETPIFARKNYKSEYISSATKKKEKASNSSRHKQGESRNESGTIKHRHKSRVPKKKKLSRTVLVGCTIAFFSYFILLSAVIRVKKQEQKKQMAVHSDQKNSIDKTKEAPSKVMIPEKVMFTNLQKHLDNWKSAETIQGEILKGSKMEGETARKKIEEQLKITPHNEVLLFKLALLLYAESAYDEAFETIIKTLNVNPTHKEAQMLLGNGLTKIQDYEGARMIGDWILEDEPFDSKAHTLVANAYLNMNKLALAIKHLHAVVDYDSRNLVAQNNLGVAYFRSENYNRAIRIFENVLAQEPLNSVTYYNLSVCYARLNKAKESVGILSKAIDHFGSAFVLQWLDKDDYNLIRSAPEYAKLRQKIAENPNSNATFSLNTVNDNKYDKDLSIDDHDFGVEVTP